jgi:hypothetical protein
VTWSHGQNPLQCADFGDRSVVRVCAEISRWCGEFCRRGSRRAGGSITRVPVACVEFILDLSRRASSRHGDRLRRPEEQARRIRVRVPSRLWRIRQTRVQRREEAPERGLICKNLPMGVVLARSPLLRFRQPSRRDVPRPDPAANPPLAVRAGANASRRAGRSRPRCRCRCSPEQVADELADRAAGDPIPQSASRSPPETQARTGRRDQLARRSAGPCAAVPPAQLVGAMFGHDQADRRHLLGAAHPPYDAQPPAACGSRSEAEGAGLIGPVRRDRGL